MHTRTWGRTGGLIVLALLTLAGGLTGCARQLSIKQDQYVNTAPHKNRPAAQRTGEPLEVAIVCVYPHDLQNPANELLKPDSRITCRDWYDRRPVADGAGHSAFVLPREQVYVLTDATDSYGRQVGNALGGAANDGEAAVVVNGIDFNARLLHDKNSVIYVFPRFLGSDGRVLEVKPAKFAPPGAYKREIAVHIGVQPDRELDEAQYIEVTSQRY